MVKTVLYLLDNFPKVSETFILNEIVELLNRGIDVRILSRNRPKEKVINEAVVKYNLIDRTTYFNRTHRYGTLDELMTLFRLMPHAVDALTLLNVGQLKTYARQFSDVDIIHTHFASTAAVQAMYLNKLTGIPYTFTAHAYEIFRKPFHSRRRLKKLVRTASAVITPSEYNRDYIIRETKCGDARYQIIRATIFPENFYPQDIPEPSSEHPKIVGIGRLVEKKGFEYLIRAVKLIVPEYPTLRVVLIGDGDLRDSLTELCVHLGISQYVTFLGDQTNEICSRELSSATLSVLPCVVAHDGDRDVCPLSLQESMALGVPVISTDVGSVPELVVDEVSGLIVPERDERRLADGIIRLLNDMVERKRLACQGRKKILEEFNIHLQAEKLLALWNSISGN